MDDRDIDLRKLDHVKNAAVAEFQARSGMWHTLMAGPWRRRGLQVSRSSKES